MRLDEAQSTDLAVSDDDVRQAEREAAEAAELAAELERRAVEDPQPPKPSEVIEQRALSGFAKMRVAHTARRAERARAAARLLALDQVGRDVAALAAEAAKPNAAIAQAARKAALAAATLAELCRQHDQQVAALVDRAKAQQVEEAAPIGPKATSAHVALVLGAYGQPDGIQAGRTRVLMIGERAKDAALRVAEGDADGAVALIASVHQQAEQRRAHRYYRSTTGQIVSEDTPQESAVFAQQVRDGDLTPLTTKEIDLYLEGRLDGTAEH